MIIIIIIYNNIFVIFNFFARITSIKTKKWATSNAIFQIINILPKFLSLITIPILVYYSESLLSNRKFLQPLFYHSLIIAEILGLTLGMLFLKRFLQIFSEIIIRESSILKIKDFIKIYFTFFLSKNSINYIKNINYTSIFSIKNRKIYIQNLFIGFLFSISIPLFMALSMIFKEYRGTFSSSISILGGIAFTLMSYFVEPKLGNYSDLVYNNKFSFKEYYLILFDCMKGKISGCFLALIFLDKIIGLCEIILNLFI